MKSFGMGIVNDGPHNDRKWLFSFGAYGWTRVLVIGPRGIEDALECAAGWLADNAPGHIMREDSEEYADLLREACAKRGVLFADYQHGDLDEETIDEVTQAAEADLTYTESGYLTSYEWGVCEQPDRETILACQSRSAWQRGQIVEAHEYRNSADQSPRLLGRVKRIHAHTGLAEAVTPAGKLLRETRDGSFWLVAGETRNFVSSLYAR